MLCSNHCLPLMLSPKERIKLKKPQQTFSSNWSTWFEGSCCRWEFWRSHPDWNQANQEGSASHCSCHQMSAIGKMISEMMSSRALWVLGLSFRGWAFWMPAEFSAIWSWRHSLAPDLSIRALFCKVSWIGPLQHRVWVLVGTSSLWSLSMDQKDPQTVQTPMAKLVVDQDILSHMHAHALVLNPSWCVAKGKTNGAQRKPLISSSCPEWSEEPPAGQICMIRIYAAWRFLRPWYLRRHKCRPCTGHCLPKSIQAFWDLGIMAKGKPGRFAMACGSKAAKTKEFRLLGAKSPWIQQNSFDFYALDTGYPADGANAHGCQHVIRGSMSRHVNGVSQAAQWAKNKQNA